MEIINSLALVILASIAINVSAGVSLYSVWYKSDILCCVLILII